MQNQGPLLTKYGKLFVGIAIVFVAVVLVLSISANIGFRVTKTNPNTSDIATMTPFLKITFSEPLSKDGLSVSADQDIIQSTHIDNDTLTVMFKPNLLNKQYKLTINSITSTQGNTITNKVFTFTPEFINPQTLPEDQAKVLDQRGNDKPYTAGFIDINGVSALQKIGLTNDQIDQFKNGLFTYFTQTKQQVRSVEIDTSSVKTPPYNPEDSNGIFTVTFNAKFDGKVDRSIRLDYTDMVATQTRIYEVGTTKQIFDSGMLGK